MKHNTISKKAYIWEYLIWMFISLLWCFQIFFRCIPNCTYWETWLIGGVIFVIVSAVGIALTWERERNMNSIVQNLLIVWGLFVSASYYELLAERIRMTAAITLGISAVMAALILFRRIRRTERRKQILRGRLFRSILCLRRNASVAMLCILIPVGYSVLFSGSILQSDVPVTKVYGDEHRLDANIEVIADIYPGRWEGLTLEEKLTVCQAIANVEGRYLGLSHELNVGVKDLEEKTQGYYRMSTHQIMLNTSHLKNDSSYEVLKTLLHECYHAYQHEVVALYQKIDAKSRNLYLFYNASVYLEEFADYVDGYEDFVAYYGQKTESDAREYAERNSLVYYARVEEYKEEEGAV